MRIGIYGGSFNPPHLGHIQSAAFAAEKLKLDKVLLIPAAQPPHKRYPEGTPSGQERLAMLEVACRGYDKLEPCDIELRQEGTSYTYRTVEQLAELYPDCEFTLLMGTDMYLSFFQWKNPEKILAHVNLGVFYRGQKEERREIDDHLIAGTTVLHNPIVDISSTQMRLLLLLDCAGGYMPAGLIEYIRSHGLYGTDKSYTKLRPEQLEQTAVTLLKPTRVAHVLGCRDTAVELARRWGADESDAFRAALLHDITKVLDGDLQAHICHCCGLNSAGENGKTIHALTGAKVAERLFGESPRVVNAIRWHTTGKAGMSLLEKIIFIADYIEPTRDFPGVEPVRAMAFEHLNQAVAMALESTVSHLHGQEIAPASAEALEYINRQLERGTLC